jgi:hypothetical protein
MDIPSLLTTAGDQSDPPVLLKRKHVHSLSSQCQQAIATPLIAKLLLL